MSTNANHDPEDTTHAIAVVQEYLNAVGPTSEDFWRSFDTYFDDETVWENVGVSRTRGREEAVSFARAFPVEFDHMRIEDLVLSAAGNRVYAERLDHFCRRDGSIVLTIRALGFFTINGRKISFWRDYFDTAGFAAAVRTQGT
jgi:limonene-1,2-epoxide hydrolase